MEDVLDLYARPYDPKRPVVCFDEQPRQLIAEVRTPVPMAPGRPQRIDYEYRRAGTTSTGGPARPTCSSSLNRWPAGGMLR